MNWTTVAKSVALVGGLCVVPLGVMIGLDLPRNTYRAESIPEEKQITLKDGRILSYSDFGDPSHEVIVYFCSTPFSRVWDFPKPTNGRLIIIERPGFGKSSFNPNHSILSFANDVTELLDQLKIEKLSIVSLSGGTPFAYALLLKIPERIKKAVIVGGMAPLSLLPATNRMVQMSHLIKKSRWTFNSIMWLTRQLYVFMGPSKFLMKSPEVKGADLAIMKREGVPFDRALKEALRGGSASFAQEVSLIWQEETWGFKLSDIKFSNLHLVHGDEDAYVPIEAAIKVSEILNAKLHIVKGKGHFLPMDREETSKIWDLCLQDN